MTSSSTKITTLVVGATGNTGRLVVQMLLDQGQNVRAIVRSKERMLSMLPNNGADYGSQLEIIEAPILSLTENELQALTKGCYAIVSCLGHNLTFKGMYGTPFLVRTAVQRLAEAAAWHQHKPPTKLLVMSSNGVANPNGQDDRRTRSERALLFVIRHLVPPHKDNEQAALHLYQMYPKDNSNSIEWCLIRPDDLVDGPVSKYDLFAKPQAGLFGAGTATRANVAHAMVDLILKDELWQKWKFEMPVLNNDPDVEQKVEA